MEGQRIFVRVAKNNSQHTFYRFPTSNSLETGLIKLWGTWVGCRGAEPDFKFTPKYVLKVKGGNLTVSPLHTSGWDEKKKRVVFEVS
jgi:hypothetical protein